MTTRATTTEACSLWETLLDSHKLLSAFQRLIIYTDSPLPVHHFSLFSATSPLLSHLTTAGDIGLENKLE